MTDDPRNPVSAASERIDEVEPFLLDALTQSWKAFKRDPSLFILGAALACMVGVCTFGLLLGPMAVGFIQTVHRRLHGQSARVRDVFDGMSSLVSALVAFVLIGVPAAVGYALAVIPGLLVAAATCFVFHEVCYRKGTAIDAIKGSIHIFKTRVLHVLLLLSGIGALNALGGVSLFALLVTVPFSVVLMTVAYEKLSGQTTGSQIALVTA